MKKTVLVLTIAVLLTSGLSAQQTGREIMQKVIDSRKADSSAMDITMTLIEKNGETAARRLQTLMMDKDGSVMTITLFLEPARVKNTRFLTISHENRDDDQWIYLPALKKVKRIAAGEQEGSFMGSDFSYSDMAGSFSNLDDYTHTILRSEQLNGYDCYVVESVPGNDSSSSYGKNVAWVDKATYLTVKVEFYSKDNSQVLKVLKSEEIKEQQGHWFAGKMTMETIASGHKTILEFKQIKYGLTLDPGYFTTNFLETGRVK